MSATDPQIVRDDRDSDHHITDWSVPVEVGGEAVAVNGSLDYSPPSDSRSIWLYGGIGVAVARRRSGRAVRPAETGALTVSPGPA